MPESPIDIDSRDESISHKHNEAGSIKNRVAKLIEPSNATQRDQEWVIGNVESINHTVKLGNHEVVYYPACGRDILRVVAAYDATHLISVDTDPAQNSSIEQQLHFLGIPFTTQMTNPARVDYSFIISGKTRTISHLTGDARLITHSAVGFKTVDVLHVFLPTGADQSVLEDEVYLKAKYGEDWQLKRWDQEARKAMLDDPEAPNPDSETGEFNIVTRAVSTTIDSHSYEAVSKGGFFVFDEKRLQFGETIPVIYKIAGLKEHKIIRRHPLTVLTSLFPGEEEIKKMSWDGYIYQKDQLVNPEIIDIVAEIFMTQFWSEYAFMEFERGNFNYLGIVDGEKFDIKTAIRDRYHELIQILSQYSERLLHAGVAQTDIDEFKTEMLSTYRRKVNGMQNRARLLLQSHADVSRRYESGELNAETARQEMGIISQVSSIGSMEFVNERFPLAIPLVLGSETKSSQVEEVLLQLSQTDSFWDGE